MTVRLVDWSDPGANDFAFAEEVTVAGANDRRPDLVLYVNGIAFAVLELKRSTVSVAEGVRQSLDAQRPEFIRPFYATVQLLLAGNDTEGLRYGAIGTPEKHWLRWKEAGARPEAGGNPLLRALGQLCARERLLEMAHDFTVFDAGVRKTCRHNQYFGVRAAQARVRRREGGIVWHTQGSGKSLTMVWLAQWIREHVPNGRVLVVTDRTELDEQIEQVFQGVGERIRRTRSGADLVDALGAGEDWLVGSLIQKFGAAEEGDVDAFVADVRRHAPARFHAAGEVFVFVDECHRTQSGKLHAAMAELLPGAMLIGFTGTPLLKSDKQRSIEVFDPYIHTYKYVRGTAVRVVRKPIKHLHLGVYPPDGRVRVAAPPHVDDDAVRLAVVMRLEWIRRRQAEFELQARQSRREMVTGESHYVDGRRYRLNVVERDGPREVRLTGNSTLTLHARPGDGRDARDAVLQRWRRRRLRDRLPALLAKWEPRVGVAAAEVRIRRMKTLWQPVVEPRVAPRAAPS